MEKTPPAKIPAKGLWRIWRALGYSLRGLQACCRNEAAFRQEIVLFALLLPVLLLLPVSTLLQLLLLIVNTLVLIAELINSTIEAVVNITSPEYNELAGQAKDMASAAVLLALILAAATWAVAIYQAFG
ncbi:MAG: diacylglycerol kinase [Desulfofustis sp.]|nr:diacylglycerol kinase [Desulfofustis sp.]